MANRMYDNLPGNMQTEYYETLTSVIGEVDTKLDEDIALFAQKPESHECFRRLKSKEVLGHINGSWEEIHSKVPSFYKFYFVSDFIEKISGFVNVLYYTHIDNLTAFMLVESISPTAYKFIYKLVPTGCNLVLMNRAKNRKLYGCFYIGQPTILQGIDAVDALQTTNTLNRDLVFLPHGAIVDPASTHVDLREKTFKLGTNAVLKLMAIENKGRVSIDIPNRPSGIEIMLNGELYTGGFVKPMGSLIEVSILGSDLEFSKVIIRMEE
ncbi:MAG: hypothetical protein ACRDDX_10585 [Cellulosilyticaceae bacterium]